MNLHSQSIRSFFIEGPAGRLEAVLNLGAPAASYAAVICHPHPMFGGTLHNKVVFHTMRALNHFGFPALRFNFRGAGLSQGKHDDGRGEVEDVRAALDWLDGEYHLPMILAGFSFGAAVGLQAACPDRRVKAAIALGLPVTPVEDRGFDFSFLKNCGKPKLFVSGSEDVFGPRAQLERTVAAAGDPKQLIWVHGGDHFFAGKLHELRASIEHWVRGTLQL